MFEFLALITSPKPRVAGKLCREVAEVSGFEGSSEDESGACGERGAGASGTIYLEDSSRANGSQR